MANPTDKLPELLKDKSQEQLILLFKELVEHHPEIWNTLELLSRLPLGSETKPSPESTPKKAVLTVDAVTIRRQAASAFYGTGRSGSGAERAIAKDLEKLREMGDKFAQAGQWEDARIIYTVVAEETIAHYNEIQDEGHISPIINDCAVGLVEYLDTNFAKLEPGEAERMEVLKLLYNLWKFDQEYSGIEEDLAGVIAAYVSENEAEHRLVENWVRQEIQTGQDSSTNWDNRRLVDFLAKLKQTEIFNEDDLREEFYKKGL